MIAEDPTAAAIFAAVPCYPVPPFGRSPAIEAYLPYGTAGPPKADLLCGLIPQEYRTAMLNHFRTALPNEAAAFVIWNEATREFSLVFPTIDEATPTRLVYRTPVLPPDCHLVCDVHSHGRGRAFFSVTDDADDADATKLALVFGKLDDPSGPEMVSRLCAGGMFLPLPRSPFAGDHRAN